MKFDKWLFICLVFFVFVNQANAQKEGNIWYFGNHAGLDFNTGAPFALIDGALSTLDGCATISDANGKLLFYTDGITVYDRTHHIMPNGKNLAGGLSSTQSAIIIPKPLNSQIYYIFTVDYQMGPLGLEYSIVDMTKNAGNGDVVTRNVKLINKACEKLTAVQNSNKKDIWVIAHDSTNKYMSFLVTDSGVRKKPVLSKGAVDVSPSNFNSIGYLKVSSGGNKFASAYKNLNLIEIGDFDNSTGLLNNMEVIPNVSTVYGLEFSPDNTKLYATNYFDQQLYQFDFSTGNINNIIKSRDTIFTSQQSALSAIQQAPDGKIYVSRDAHDHLGVIASPNNKGKSCKYTDNGFDLNGKICYSGLPTFVQSFFIPVTDFIFANTCLGDATRFIGKTNINPDKWFWDFGDPVSTTHNTDNAQNPVHYFSAPGTFTVKMVVSLNGATDTISKTLTITDVPVVNLGADQVSCIGNPIVLDAGKPGFKYQWSTGDTMQKIRTDSSGIYWVTVSKGDCKRSDTTKLLFTPIGNYKLGGNKIVCGKSSIVLSKYLKGAHVLWSTGETDTAITITKTGTYWIRVSSGPCVAFDTIIVFFEKPPVVYLGKDTMLCEGQIDTLNAGVKGAAYLWSTGATTQKIGINSGGHYWVKVSAGGCVVYDTINIRHCPANIYIPDVFTPNGDHMNDTFKPFGTDINQALLTVVNRWGEIVFHDDTVKNGWDGNFNGQPCPEGLYGYIIIYREYDGEVLYDHRLTGTVFLSR